MAAVEQPKKVTGGAFGRFLAESRPALQKECAGKPVTAVVKLASERFKALPESEKAVFQQKYKQAQEQYEKAMAAFLSAGGEKAVVKRKGDKADKANAKKQKKDPEAPKRPAGGAFGCFLAKNRATFTKACAGKPVTAISKLAGERWKELGPVDRQPFEKEYAAKKAEYEEAMKSYTPPVVAANADGDEESLETSPKKVAKKAKASKAEEKAAAKTAKAKMTFGKITMKGAAKAKAKAKAKKAVGPPVPELEASVAKKAEAAGLSERLLVLAARQDIIESGKSQMQMLKALEGSGGLIHPARRTLLGA